MRCSVRRRLLPTWSPTSILRSNAFTVMTSPTCKMPTTWWLIEDIWWLPRTSCSRTRWAVLSAIWMWCRNSSQLTMATGRKLRDGCAVRSRSQVRVKSGGIGILTLPDTRGFLQSAFLAGSKIPVPEWTYKVVRDATGNGLYVFLTYNSTFQMEKPPCLAICYPVNCPIHLPNNPNDGYTFCCDPKRFPY